MLSVLITDADHGFYEPEREVATERGVELRIADGDPARIEELGSDADAILCQYVRVDGALLDRLPRCRVIGRYGVGVDNIDLDAARERGCQVVNVPDFCVEEVADHALALALAATRRVVALDRAWRADPITFAARWQDRVEALEGVERSSEVRFGLVGLGRIGQAVAHRAAACGYEVVAHDPLLGAAEVRAGGAEPKALDELLSSSHVVSLHLPLSAETERVIGARELALMRPGSVLVNTARGALVDEDALVVALRDGRPGFAALDVFATEPLPSDHALLTEPNVILTPHVAFFSRASILELKRRALTAVVDAAERLRTP